MVCNMKTNYTLNLSIKEWKLRVNEAIGIAELYSISGLESNEQSNIISCFGSKKDIRKALQLLRQNQEIVYKDSGLNVNEQLIEFQDKFMFFMINFLDEKNKFDAVLFLYNNPDILVSRLLELCIEIQNYSLNGKFDQQIIEEYLFYIKYFDIELDNYFSSISKEVEYTVEVEKYEKGILYKFVNINPEIGIKEGEGYQTEINSKKISVALAELDSFFKNLPSVELSHNEIKLAEYLADLNKFKIEREDVVLENIEIMFLDNLESRIYRNEMSIEKYKNPDLHEIILEFYSLIQNNILYLLFLLLGIMEVYDSDKKLDRMDRYLEAAKYFYSIYHEKISKDIIYLKDDELTYSVFIKSLYGQIKYVEKDKKDIQ